jgi:hypothetical protein
LLSDRQTQRRAAAIGRLSVTSADGRIPLEFASQLISWRKADLLNPTGAIAPRDYLNVVDEFWEPCGESR